MDNLGLQIKELQPNLRGIVRSDPVSDTNTSIPRKRMVSAKSNKSKKSHAKSKSINYASTFQKQPQSKVPRTMKATGHNSEAVNSNYTSEYEGRS